MSNIGSDLNKLGTDGKALVKSWAVLAGHWTVAAAIGAAALYVVEHFVL